MKLGLLVAVIVVAVGGATCLGAQRRSPYRLPVEQAATLPPSPGADLTAAQCSACHSLDYLTAQPRGKGAKFWEDSVAKMRTVYRADISDGDAATITGYLALTFGEPAAGRR
jgi:mono/diheme cytochrome c family protein